VRVHDVRRLGAPGRSQLAREVGHVRRQVVLRDRPRRAGVDVVHRHPGRELDARGQVGVVAARVHDDLDVAARQRRGQRGDVHVLPAGVHAAQHGERARVLGHHRDSHRLPISSSRSFQSARKRSSP
jgi:hypothetical protein